MNAKLLPSLFPIAFFFIAALFVFIGYDSQLPILDTDEGILLAQTLRERGIGQYEVMQVPGYPPFILGLYLVVQRTTELMTGESVLQHAELVIRVMRLYWKADTLPVADYHLYLHLSPIEVHEALAQADGTPALPSRPTTTWDDPNETLISPQYHITIPADLPPGQYRLLAGLYHFHTGQRLLTADGDDALLLSMITVS